MNTHRHEEYLGKRRCKLTRTLRRSRTSVLHGRGIQFNGGRIEGDLDERADHVDEIPVDHDLARLKVIRADVYDRRTGKVYGVTGAVTGAGVLSAGFSGGFLPSVIASITSCVPLLYRLRSVVVMS